MVKMPPYKAPAKRVVGEYDVSIDGHRLSGDLTEEGAAALNDMIRTTPLNRRRKRVDKP